MKHVYTTIELKVYPNGVIKEAVFVFEKLENAKKYFNKVKTSFIKDVSELTLVDTETIAKEWYTGNALCEIEIHDEEVIFVDKEKGIQEILRLRYQVLD